MTFRRGDTVYANHEMRRYSNRILPGTPAKVVGPSQGSDRWTVVRLMVNGKPANYETTVPNYAISPPTALDLLAEV